ncbi:MAG: branched-chain amino acid ABC transporter permease [Deltaproteobacteria bacterium]|nr:branched-chain amino acid ABC transporter permease [Deltaproteobacteria bacterium]
MKSIYVLVVTLAVGLMCCLPIFLGPHSLHIVILTLISLIVATSWNILLLTHQISLGHAGFFGVGAYTCGALCEKFMPIVPLDILVGGIIAALFAVILGVICCRMTVWAIAIVTLAFAEVLKVLVIMVPSIADGAEGIRVPPIFGGVGYEKIACFYLVLFVSLLSLTCAYAIRKSKLYYAFAAVHDDEEAAGMLGVNPLKFKIIAFSVSAFMTGVAGGIFAHYISFIDPYTVFGLHISLDAQIMPLVGGLYTILGPVIGSFVLTSAGEVFRIYFGSGYLIAYGCILVAFVLFLPEGIVGWAQRLARR